MEFVVATNPVPTTGGTLNLDSAPLTYSYQNSAFGTNGQYTYQVILIQPHFNIKLNRKHYHSSVEWFNWRSNGFKCNK